MEENTHTEKLILDAALQVFSQKGFAGTRMHEIADLAGINKALLHYYFRCKKKLFEKILEIVFNELANNLFSLNTENSNWKEVIYKFCQLYIDFFKDKRFIPQFVINELGENPDWILKHFSKLNILNTPLLKDLSNSIKNELNKEVPISEIMINMISLLILPIMVGPLMQIIINQSEESYNLFIENRKKIVPKIIIEFIENYKVIE
jgi:AcrR family transcriptional regulator